MGIEPASIQSAHGTRLASTDFAPRLVPVGESLARSSPPAAHRSGAKVGEYGFDAAVAASVLGEAELLEDVPDVAFDGLR
jgi:hypothetical protein